MARAGAHKVTCAMAPLARWPHRAAARGQRSALPEAGRGRGAAGARRGGILSALLVAAATCAWGPARAYLSPCPAMQHYTKALRGAATPEPGRESAAFRRLARLHYEAVMFRRSRQFGRALAVYRQAMGMHLRGEFPLADEVPAAVAAAHAALNLALTEQAQDSYTEARRTFKDGVSQVQELIRDDYRVWVDGHNRVRFVGDSLGGALSTAFGRALKWLATLLTAWALMETKRGRAGVARLLAQRAAHLDESKAQVLRWHVVHSDEADERGAVA